MCRVIIVCDVSRGTHRFDVSCFPWNPPGRPMFHVEPTGSMLHVSRGIRQAIRCFTWNLRIPPANVSRETCRTRAPPFANCRTRAPPLAKGGSGGISVREAVPVHLGALWQAIRSPSGSAPMRGRGVTVSNWVGRPTAPQTPSLRGASPLLPPGLGTQGQTEAAVAVAVAGLEGVAVRGAREATEDDPGTAPQDCHNP